MISAVGLSKRFGPRLALHLVDLEVPRGEVVALLGPNGAGKSTLLRILATLTKPTFGEARVAGYRLQDQGAQARARLGFVGHQPLLYEDLSAQENLAFYARLHGLKQPGRRIQELLKLFDLGDRSTEPVRSFSRGMQQRLALARALLHTPRLLLLDEPYSGLDRQTGAALDATLRRLARGGVTILLATHDLARAQRVATRVEVLAGGRVVASALRSKLASSSFPAFYDRALRAAATD